MHLLMDTKTVLSLVFLFFVFESLFLSFFTHMPHPNQCHMETKLPAMQAEQVEDDVAPITAEYVPA